MLGSVVGRRYLTQFLEQVGSVSLIGYWAAVEELRQTSRSSWHQLGAEIFYKYINTPSPDIRVDKVSNFLCWSKQRRSTSNIVFISVLFCRVTWHYMPEFHKITLNFVLQLVFRKNIMFWEVDLFLFSGESMGRHLISWVH